MVLARRVGPGQALWARAADMRTWAPPPQGREAERNARNVIEPQRSFLTAQSVRSARATAQGILTSGRSGA